jgi:hypothetical protein
MSRARAAQKVYPPRYFTGHVTLTDGKRSRRVEFFNCVQIPISAKEARLFPAFPGSPFYGEAADSLRKFDGWRLVDVQYAISVFDRAKSGHRIEKFNHPFETDTRFIVHDDYVSIMCPDGSDVYKDYKVNEVMDEVSENDVPITQFIS